MEHVVKAGAELSNASAAIVLVHGRGASAQSMLSFAEAIGVDGVAYRAPQAPGYTWYPHSFLAPLEANEPGISSGIRKVLDAVEDAEEAGVPIDRIVLLGFSQGACLATETAARHPKRYGGVIALSGGLIGSGQIQGASPPDDKQFDYPGSISGTPVFIGCSDVDPHIPVERVRRTADVLRDLGGDVTLRIYEGMGHTVNDEELGFARDLVQSLVTG